MLAALTINAQGRDQTLAVEVLAVDQKRSQIFRHWPLTERAQFQCRRRFPLPTDAGPINPIALQTVVNGLGIVASRDLVLELACHRPLHATVLLKGFTGPKLYFLGAFLSHARLLKGHFASGID